MHEASISFPPLALPIASARSSYLVFLTMSFGEVNASTGHGRTLTFPIYFLRSVHFREIRYLCAIY